MDSLEIKLTPEMLSINDWREIEKNFNYQSLHFYPQSNKEYRRQNMNNLNVSLSESSLTIRGSLSKFIFENNCYSLTFEDIKTVLQLLEDNLHIPLKKAEVTRLDFADNLLMEYPPECYIKHLLDIDGYSRYDNKSSLLFKGKNTEISFYNKNKEKKDKFNATPKIWKGENILRYELKLKKNLSSIFETKVRVSNLFDEDFYIQLWEKWAETYYQIKKSREVTINLMKCNKPKDFEDQILKLGYMAYGFAEALEDVNQLQKLKRFKDASQCSKLKAKIKSYLNQEVFSPPNELVHELDSKIEQAIMYYR